MENYRSKYLAKDDALDPIPTPFEELATGFNRRLIEVHTKPGDRVLDVGCNKGFLLATMPRRRTFGLDLSFGYRSPGPYYVIGDASLLPFRDGSFQAVAMAEVIEHLPDCVAPYKEVWRVLRPGGVSLITHPNKHNILQEVLERVKENRWVRLALGRSLYTGTQHLRSYSAQDTSSILEGLGFTPLEVHTPSLGLLRLLSPLVYGRLRCESVFPLIVKLGKWERKISLKIGHRCSILPGGYTLLFTK